MTVPGKGGAPAGGLLLLRKKPGFTSFDSLGAVKRAFATTKAGHTGTLDKFASGLLLVLVGKGVKLVPLFSGCDKEYTGRIRFGEETDTLDPEGEVIARGKIPSREEVEAALSGFRGDILQAPPAYSALHINGRRAHELVREGKAPDMKKRPVTVYALELVSWSPPDAEIRALVSPGTYIRSLARDIAAAAGSRGYLRALERTKVGPFRLKDSAGDDEDSMVKALRPLDRKLFGELSLPCFTLDENAAAGFVHGKPLEGLLGKDADCLFPGVSAAGVFLETSAGSSSVGKNSAGTPEKLLGTLASRDGKWSYGHVFAAG